MRRPTVYIFMNKSLQMSPGKLAAQAAHAMAEVSLPLDKWARKPNRWVMIMEARDQQHLENIKSYLGSRGLHSYPIIDEGVNETDPHVMTALAVELVDKDAEFVQDTFSSFITYREHYRIILETSR